MLTITSIRGNIHSDKMLAEAHGRLSSRKKVETVLVSRPEAQRSRMRRRSDAGTDVAIALEEDHHLRDGDVLLAEENRMIVLEYEPEDVLRFRIKENLQGQKRVDAAVKLGHFLGNLHRPISTRDGEVHMPVQSQVDVEGITKALGPMASWLEIRQLKTVFEPEEGVGFHTH